LELAQKFNWCKGESLRYQLLLSPEKEAKIIGLFPRRAHSTQTSAKPTPGVWGLAPKKTQFKAQVLPIAIGSAMKSRWVEFLLFPEKEAKSVGLLRSGAHTTQTSAKPTLGVWGLAPKKKSIQSEEVLSL
jgi:hypothetical protein